MKIGYLHIGPIQHGIYRYSKLLAAQAHTLTHLTVLESHVVLSECSETNRKSLLQAAKLLRNADIVHFQYNRSLWGSNDQRSNLEEFIRACSQPLVVTIHDTYVKSVDFSLISFVSYFRASQGRTARFFRWLLSQVDQALVCTQQEANRLESIRVRTLRKPVVVLPHFIEKRSVERSANCTLEPGQESVVTLLGWIHPRKGHRLVVESLPDLPVNVKVVFAGQPSKGAEGFVEELLSIASAQGVSERLQITGYLTEAELEKYLLLTDVAVCPFEDFSASGSLSTWLSIAHPKILASALPQIEEYNQLGNGAISTFKPYTHKAFSVAVQELLSSNNAGRDVAVKRIQDKLGIEAIFEHHLSCYKQLV